MATVCLNLDIFSLVSMRSEVADVEGVTIGCGFGVYFLGSGCLGASFGAYLAASLGCYCAGLGVSLGADSCLGDPAGLDASGSTSKKAFPTSRLSP